MPDHIDAHTHHEGMMDTRDIGWAIVLVSVALGVTFVVCVLYFWESISTTLIEKQDTSSSLQLSQLRIYETEQLNRLGWIDQAKGQVQIPVSVAIDHVLDRYHQ